MTIQLINVTFIELNRPNRSASLALRLLLSIQSRRSTSNRLISMSKMVTTAHPLSFKNIKIDQNNFFLIIATIVYKCCFFSNLIN